ncbi:hypothetical protein P154DRAFT_35782 [Amniculicola lignicola CBS 123094]|uniref:Uncharacterized protein n=1 Tax=Amniculicola lignicola CBS 123094 TaxID=1392246 RepID=A0A6A5WV86_9PLEO|nr:hypothetical protein P154DRAFT_35782 [Amniculicola lignicola CBS 123094]
MIPRWRLNSEHHTRSSRQSLSPCPDPYRLCSQPRQLLGCDELRICVWTSFCDRPAIVRGGGGGGFPLSLLISRRSNQGRKCTPLSMTGQKLCSKDHWSWPLIGTAEHLHPRDLLLAVLPVQPTWHQAILQQLLYLSSSFDSPLPNKPNADADGF